MKSAPNVVTSACSVRGTRKPVMDADYQHTFLGGHAYSCAFHCSSCCLQHPGTTAVASAASFQSLSCMFMHCLIQSAAAIANDLCQIEQSAAVYFAWATTTCCSLDCLVVTGSWDHRLFQIHRQLLPACCGQEGLCGSYMR